MSVNTDVFVPRHEGLQLVPCQSFNWLNCPESTTSIRAGRVLTCFSGKTTSPLCTKLPEMRHFTVSTKAELLSFPLVYDFMFSCTFLGHTFVSQTFNPPSGFRAVDLAAAVQRSGLMTHCAT